MISIVPDLPEGTHRLRKAKEKEVDYRERIDYDRKKERQMIKRLWTLICPLAALILEVLPYGAVLNFGTVSESGETTIVRHTYSYFNPIACGYANFTPMITAIGTCALLVLLIIYCITERKSVVVFVKNFSCALAVISSLAYLFDFRYFSVVGGLITLCLLGEFIALQVFLYGITKKKA